MFDIIFTCVQVTSILETEKKQKKTDLIGGRQTNTKLTMGTEIKP